jgi:hypothetical protein
MTDPHSCGRSPYAGSCVCGMACESRMRPYTRAYRDVLCAYPADAAIHTTEET